jgi:hypothetical protein
MRRWQRLNRQSESGSRAFAELSTVEAGRFNLAAGKTLPMITDQGMRQTGEDQLWTTLLARSKTLGLNLNHSTLNARPQCRQHRFDRDQTRHHAIKYAFPVSTGSERVLVGYETRDFDWRLVVADNGLGRSLTEKPAEPGSGLGSLIIEALAKQLDARVEIASSDKGMSVTVAHARFHSTTSTAA